MPRTVLVFSTDERGSHTGGAAPLAIREFGAKPGLAEGLQGSSYGIPTHDKLRSPLPCRLIKTSMERFIDFAERHPDTLFEVTPLAQDLPTETQLAIETLLSSAPSNCFITPQSPRDKLQPCAEASRQA